MQIKDADFVVVDLETTGLEPDHARILEIAAVRVKGNTVIDTFEQLVNPESKVPWQITNLTGIMTNDIVGQPIIADVLPRFIEFLGDAIFVAHNVRFDWGFIAAEISRAGLPSLKNQKLCTVRIARRLLRGLKSKSLESLIHHFRIHSEDHHRALIDAIATQEVFAKLLLMLERQHEITTLEELLNYQYSSYNKSSAERKRLDHIREHYLKNLPDSPGVYHMRRKDGKLLYIGKARVLRDRVRSYFAGTENHAKHIRAMIGQVHEIQWTDTETELEALLLESRLIKEYIPPFNKAGRKHRNRVFLRLGDISDSGWITLIQHIRADGARHYGPMATRKEATYLAQILVSLYGASPSGFQSLEGKGVGLEASRIGGPLTEEGFECVSAFLEGKDTSAFTLLERRMKEYSQVKEYEQAAQIRDELEFMTSIHSRPNFLRIPLLKRTGVVIHTFNATAEVHFIAYGFPIAHIVWPSSSKILDTAKTMFKKRVLHPPDRLSMQQVDAITILGSWMFKERGRITVLLLASKASFMEFFAGLEENLDQLHSSAKK